MPSQPHGSISSDDEEAPETLSLIDSRRDGEKRADTIKQIQAVEKEKKRARNRERDRRLKEQAQNSKRRRNGVDESGEKLEARMKRAMEEAEAELDSDDEHEHSEDHDEGEFQGGSASPDDEDSSENDDEDISESEQETEEAESRSNDKANITQSLETRSNPNHLPEHLFTSAFTSSTVKSSKSLSKRKADDEEDSKRRAKKRARKNNPSKDIVIGSKTIRTLVYDRRPSGAGTIPSSKVKKFIDRTLALKGGNSKSRGWERKAANIGSMRRNGPATNFVRNR